MTPAGSALTVYVMEACPGCSRAHELAGEVSRRMPNVSVRIVDLSEQTEPQPDYVFSVPTWVLDGQVISLGNPRFSTLVAAVSGRREAEGERHDHGC